MYIHEKEKRWEFSYNTNELIKKLGNIREKEGLLLGKMSQLGFDFQNQSLLEHLSSEIVHSSAIEGESLNLKEVRSSIANKLGIDTARLVPSSHHIDGIVEMLLDATQNYNTPLTEERLFSWHRVLFPYGYSGLYKIEVGQYRSREMQVDSGQIGNEKVHFKAVEPNKIAFEMKEFIEWFNNSDELDGIIKASIAHLRFLTIHPFDDGNGRIARALTDMLFARTEKTSRRFYSMSVEIKKNQKSYYEILEKTQKGNGDITDWLLWFINCFDKALDTAFLKLQVILQKTHFWNYHQNVNFNERQQKMINMLFEGFKGNLTTQKWAKLNKCSQDTALNDINDLISHKILVKSKNGGRSTHYIFNDMNR